MKIQEQRVGSGYGMDGGVDLREAVVGNPGRRELLVQAAQEAAPGQHLQDPRRVVLLKDSAELDALPLGRHLVPIAVLDRRIEQGLGALFRLEVKAQAEAEQAVDARGVFHEAAAMQDPKLA